MKKLAVFLALVLVFTGVMPALAAEDISEYVLAVKNRVPISEVCTEFDGAPRTRDGKVTYNLNWSSPDDAKNREYVSVTVNDNNIITSYNAYNNNSKYGKVLPQISKEQALMTAKEFFAKANPDIAGVYDFDKASVSYNMSAYYVFVERYVDVPVYGNNASFSVNGETGVVENMNVSYTPYLVFVNVYGVITPDGAKAAFEKLGGLELVYKSFETGDETPVARPIYVSSGKGLRINAGSGSEYIGKQYSDEGYRESLKNEVLMDSMAGGGAQLTPQEIEEIGKLAELISPDEAEAKIKAMPELMLDSGAVCAYSSVHKSGKDKYIMNMGFEWENGFADATLNAKTGEILNFYGYDNTSYKEEYPADKGKAEAEAFAEKYLSEYLNNAKVNESSVLDKMDTQYRMTWERTQDGLLYAQNTVSVTVDKETLKVSRFNVNWTEDLVFEGIDGIISSGEAYEKLFSYITPELVYYINENQTAASYVYMTEFGDIGSIYAKDGVALDFAGEVYKKQEQVEYTDISGHYAETQIKGLFDVGVGFYGGQFMPDKIITQGEYIELVSDCVFDYRPLLGSKADGDRIYNHVVSRGVMEKDDIDPDAPLTREKAVTYLLRAMNYGAFAEIEGIFRCDFADADSITPELFGYVAIARGLKIISGAEDNNFLPQKQMTRAEAAVILYNYLSK